MCLKNNALTNVVIAMAVTLSLFAAGGQPPSALAGPATRPAEPSTIRVYVLKYAQAENVARMVSATIGDEAKCAAERAGNRLVVSAPPAVFDKIDQLILQLDQSQKEEQRETIVIQLQHASANDLARMLQDTLSDANIQLRAWDRTNCIVVNGSKAGIERVKSLIKELDREAVSAGQAEEVITIYPLVTKPDNGVEGALGLVLGDRGRFSVDTVRNTVIVKADAQGTRRAQQIIKALDVPEQKAVATQASTQYRVRLVWLVSGLKREGALPPPADLKEVVDELAKISITDLSLVDQTVITATGEEFKVESAPELIGYPPRLRFEGRFLAEAKDASSRQLSVRIEVDSRETSSQTGPGCRLESTIAAPVGHSVVLGVTSMRNMASVFVLQLLPAK